ncbi:hypothetical protein Mtai_v1c17570 [Meiothermus taiwanensis WR-220]|uniref:Uncharacterized protein n=1 Tax=Meiothermus taiwanensis WR-220 TaxID=1339250 RepID=A0ABN5LXQ2_9DEIN|nr:hypothetical protein Mtai_v1c17570 [Meiothermus taiwanensis WR-220]
MVKPAGFSAPFHRLESFGGEGRKAGGLEAVLLGQATGYHPKKRLPEAIFLHPRARPSKGFRYADNLGWVGLPPEDSELTESGIKRFVLIGDQLRVEMSLGVVSGC